MDNNLIYHKIDKLKILKSETKPLWGKMTAQHMVEHLILAVKSGNGSLTIECTTPKEKLPILKRFLFSNRPFPKNYINPSIGKDLKPLEFENLNSAIQSLKNETDKFYAYFKNKNDAKPINPTYGELDFKEWLQFHKRHFDHHLEQFEL